MKQRNIKVNQEYVNIIRAKGLSVNRFIADSLGLGVPKSKSKHKIGVPKIKDIDIKHTLGVPKVDNDAKYNMFLPVRYCDDCINNTAGHTCKVHKRTTKRFNCFDCPDYITTTL